MVEEAGARAIGEMIHKNTWVTHLNLSDCGIGDVEIGFIAKGLQVIQ